MILACHVIFCAYGFWLPNDPRGSWSNFVGSWELAKFGPATKTNTRRSVAGAPHDRQVRHAAKRAMKYPPVRFTGLQARAVGRGFADYIHRSGITVYACSILPEHVHMVVGRHDYHAEQMVNLLKGAATRRLVAEGLHPLAGCRDRRGRVPKPWADGEWKVFLDHAAAVERSIGYVEGNPVKEGKRRQRWGFVTPYG